MFSSSLKVQPKQEVNKQLGEERRSDFSSLSDENIWIAFQDGNEGAFIHIYKNYANVLFNFGMKFCQDRDLVKDCLQDFFVYLRKSRSKLSTTNSIKLYLMKSFRRRVIEYVNKAQNEKKRNSDAVDFTLQIENSHEMKFIEAQVDSENAGRLTEALDKLDPREREAVYYFYYEGIGYKQIAEMMEFTHVSSARRLIYRALGHLKELF